MEKTNETQVCIPVIKKEKIDISYNLLDVNTGYINSYNSVSLFSANNGSRLDRKKSTKSLFDCSKCSLSDLETYKCSRCAFKTNLRVLLYNHIVQVHKATAVALTMKNIVKCFTCKLCPFQTHSLFMFTCHVCQSALGVKGAAKTKIGKKLNKPLIKWFECDHCAFRTKYKCNLKTHKAGKHAADKNITWFRCQYCEYKTKLKNRLNTHLSQKHKSTESIKLLKCDYCPYKVKHYSVMQGHVLRKHVAERDINSFKCEFCPFKASFNSALQRHLTIKHSAHKISLPLYVKVINANIL